MECIPISYHETELLLINGRWCLTNNGYGKSPEEMFGKPTKRVLADATASYSMYYDDLCCDVYVFRVNGKWGLLLKSEIIGMGCANYQSDNDNPFVYDDFMFLVGGDRNDGHAGPRKPKFYASIRGLIAVKKNGLWGILKVFKKDFVPLMYKEIVPCEFRTTKEAATAITDLTDKEKREIIDVMDQQSSDGSCEGKWTDSTSRRNTTPRQSTVSHGKGRKLSVCCNMLKRWIRRS